MKTILKEITRADVKTINRWRHDREVVGFLGTPFRFINLETDGQWFDDYLKNRKNQVRCGIYVRPSNKLIGVVYLTQIDHVNRNAELSIMIGDRSYWGKRIGAAAAQSMLEHAFKDLNLHRVYLSVLKDNARAVRMYKNLGFKQEGKLEDALFKNGEYKDLILFGMTKKDFVV